MRLKEENKPDEIKNIFFDQVKKSSYKKKKKRRINRYKELAKKNKRASSEAYEKSNKLVSVVPMGQPVLVGHHSERSHRNLIKKVR